MRREAPSTPRFLSVPPRLEAMIQRECVRRGVLSLFAGPLLGIAAFTLHDDLMTAKQLHGLCAMLVFSSGLNLLFGGGCVSAGQLDLAHAARIRRLLLAVALCEVVLLAYSYAPLVRYAADETAVAGPSLVRGLVLPIPMLALACVNYGTARSLLPPRREVLTEYGSTGQDAAAPMATPPGREG